MAFLEFQKKESELLQVKDRLTQQSDRSTDEFLDSVKGGRLESWRTTRNNRQWDWKMNRKREREETKDGRFEREQSQFLKDWKEYKEKIHFNE